ncbi:hypothetical protein ACSBR2_027337 [Camellia fascicularis]
MLERDRHDCSTARGPTGVNRKFHSNCPGTTSTSLSFKHALTTLLFSNSTPTPSPPDTFSDDEELDEDEFVPAITLTSEDKARIRTPWLKAIIVKLMGRNIGFNYFMTRIKALWKPTGAIIGLDLGNHFYIIKFLNDEDLSKVLNEGPWFIGAHFIAIGAKLGTLLKIDVHTENGNKGRFARLCVQVDLSKPLIAKIKIGTITQRVSYEGISLICFDCGKLGHKRAASPQATPILDSNNSLSLQTFLKTVISQASPPPIQVCLPLTSSSETFTLPSSVTPDSASLTPPNDPICLPPPNPIPHKTYNTLTPQSHPLNTIPPPPHSFAYPTNASSPYPSPAKQYDVQKLEKPVKSQLRSPPRCPDSLQTPQPQYSPKSLHPPDPQQPRLVHGNSRSPLSSRLFSSNRNPEGPHPHTWLLNQIIVPTTNFLPNLQPFLDPCLAETLLPTPPLPTLDHHCLANHLRTFVLEGHCYQAERIIAEPNLHLLRVSVESFIMQGNLSLIHNIALIPTLAFDPMPLEDNPLGPGWITNSKEVINKKAITSPLLPLFNPPMKVLLWNCRGTASPHFRRHFFTLVNEYHPQLVILTETRVGGTRGKTLSENLGFSNGHISDPIDFSGGIWLLWNDLEIDCEVLLTTEQEIHAWIKVPSNPSPWLFSAIYASPHYNQRCILWDNLMLLSNTHSSPWLMLGDFNEILTSADKFGGRAI